MSLPIAQPADIGFDARRLDVANQLLRAWTSGDSPVWPAAALVVGRGGSRVDTRRFGRQGPEPGAEALRPDGLFLLASLTKPLTYLGAMVLVERGQLNLTDPVIRYLPEFGARGKEATLVEHLFTHTSGLPDMLDNNIALRQEHAPLERYVQHTMQDVSPLFRPGTGFSYQSMGTLIVAEIIQRLTGKPIANFLHDELFEPLRLRAMLLGARGVQPERMVRVRTPAAQDPQWGWNSAYWRGLGAPWGGAQGTAEDLAVVCQMMLDQGSAGGRRLFSPRTIARMTENRLNDFAELPEPLRQAHAWGLGWQMNHPGQPDALCDLLDHRAFGHHGSTGTMLWMDPPSGSFCVLLTTAPRDDAPWRLMHISNVVASALL